MVKPRDLVEGRCYFDITYADATMSKPIVATYEYVAVEEIESDAGGKEPFFLFRFHPKYKSDDPGALENGFIGYRTAQLSSLRSIAELTDELDKIRRKIDASGNA